MNPTEQSLLQKFNVSKWHIEARKKLFNFKENDEAALANFYPTIQQYVEPVINAFYVHQTQIEEVATIISDADTLLRLKTIQKKNVLALFEGVYDEKYITSRLRIGIVHKRIGLPPYLYLGGIYELKRILSKLIYETTDNINAIKTITALEKLMYINVSFVIETFVKSLIDEAESAKSKIEIYAQSLEEKVLERTKQLEELSRTDSLTSLLNPRAFREALQRELKVSIRNKTPLSLIFIDVDKFKQINDNQGHHMGDKILIDISKCLKTTIRETDISARYGGDEFCLILPDCDQENAKLLAERLIETARTVIPTSLSLGIATTGPDFYCDLETLLRKADDQMYFSKTHSDFSHHNILINRAPAAIPGIVPNSQHPDDQEDPDHRIAS